MEPTVVLALVAFIASLGSIAFAVNSVSKLSDQYTVFVRTHIHDLRHDLNREGKRVAKIIDQVIREVESSARSGNKTDGEITELRNQLYKLNAKLKLIEDETGQTSRRVRR